MTNCHTERGHQVADFIRFSISEGLKEISQDMQPENEEKEPQ